MVWKFAVSEILWRNLLYCFIYVGKGTDLAVETCLPRADGGCLGFVYWFWSVVWDVR